MKKQLVICGGGSSAHSLISFLKDSVFDVSIYTSKPDKWDSNVKLEYQDTMGEIIDTFWGELKKASNNPQELIPGADYIVFCMPVHKYREALKNIAPYIKKDKKVFIGTIYGQGGFNWMVNEIERKYFLSNIVTFSFGLIPWICRTIEYGKIGVTYGPKSTNYAAVYPKCYFGQVKEEFFDYICYKWFGKGKTEQSDNFLSLTLSVDNQIIHTSRCLGLYNVYGKTWQREEDVPMFYKDYDDISANMLADLDSDYSKIRNKIKTMYPNNNYKYMMDYLSLERFSYQSQNIDIKESFVTSQTLIAIKTPVIQNEEGLWEIDKENRFFMDDIYYGNCIAKWIAEQMNINVPTIDNILKWAQLIRKENLIDENNKLLLSSKDLSAPLKSGIPCYYGLNSIDEIID